MFAVIEVDKTIYSSESSLEATGAGWLLLAIVDVRFMFASCDTAALLP